jgi:hypothetical protein
MNDDGDSPRHVIAPISNDASYQMKTSFGPLVQAVFTLITHGLLSKTFDTLFVEKGYTQGRKD